MSYFSSKFSDDLLAVWASGVVLFLFFFFVHCCCCCCCSFSHILIDSTSFIFPSGIIMFNTTLQAIACENSRLSSLLAARNKGRRLFSHFKLYRGWGLYDLKDLGDRGGCFPLICRWCNLSLSLTLTWKCLQSCPNVLFFATDSFRSLSEKERPCENRFNVDGWELTIPWTQCGSSFLNFLSCNHWSWSFFAYGLTVKQIFSEVFQGWVVEKRFLSDLFIHSFIRSFIYLFVYLFNVKTHGNSRTPRIA